MLIQLPVETWIEILDWLRRRDLVKKLDELWDREFTPIVQDWLHKYTRNVQIGSLWAAKDGLSVILSDANKDGEGDVPFAEVDLPENVTSFKWITIDYLDSSLLAFLRRMRPLLRRGICLDIANFHDEASIRTVLRHLMPMFSSSNSSILALSSLHGRIPLLFYANFPSAFFNVRLLRVWRLEPADDVEPMISWLFTPREDGQPRLFWLYCKGAGFYEKIRKRFLDSARQCASQFFVQCLLDAGLPTNAPSSAIENARTGEQLSVQHYADRHCALIINYCPSTNVDPDWLARNTAQVLDWDWRNQDRIVWICSPEIGPIVDVVEEHNEQQQIDGE